MAEKWLPIPSLGGRYEANSDGRIRNPKTKKVLKGWLNQDGYRRVCLADEEAKYGHTNYFVHRLVAEVFLGYCPEGQQVRHLNGNPDDNRHDNLLYGTPSENVLDTVGYGNHYQARKTSCGTCGKPYDEVNTYIFPNGARGCRNCIRASGKRYDERYPGRRAELKKERRKRARESNEFLTTGEAAKQLGVSSETIRRWCDRGLLPFDQPGQHRRVHRQDILNPPAAIRYLLALRG